jgi:hypothetical protein
MNLSIVQITTNIQLKSNHPMYSFNHQITMDIQFEYPTFAKINSHNQSHEFNHKIEMKIKPQTLF